MQPMLRPPISCPITCSSVTVLSSTRSVLSSSNVTCSSLPQRLCTYFFSLSVFLPAQPLSSDCFSTADLIWNISCCRKVSLSICLLPVMSHCYVFFLGLLIIWNDHIYAFAYYLSSINISSMETEKKCVCLSASLFYFQRTEYHLSSGKYSIWIG